jgi:sodium/bile acid cotransporter 7
MCFETYFTFGDRIVRSAHGYANLEIQRYLYLFTCGLSLLLAMPKLVASGVSAKEFYELKSGAVNPLVIDGTSDGAHPPASEPSASEPSAWQVALKWADGQRFLIGVVLAILVAFAYPKGGLALAPEITASWVAVVFIFLMSGLSLKTKELKKASKRMDFNCAVQAFNLCLLTLSVAALTEALRQTGINVAILDGMVLCAALPMTVNKKDS